MLAAPQSPVAAPPHGVRVCQGARRRIPPCGAFAPSRDSYAASCSSDARWLALCQCTAVVIAINPSVTAPRESPSRLGPSALDDSSRSPLVVAQPPPASLPPAARCAPPGEGGDCAFIVKKKWPGRLCSLCAHHSGCTHSASCGPRSLRGGAGWMDGSANLKAKIDLILARA